MTDRIPAQARNLRRATNVFAGYDAGLYGLPDELSAARDAIVRLHRERESAIGEVPDVGLVEEKLIADTAAAAMSRAKRLPDVGPLSVAQATAADGALRVRVLTAAVERADNQFGALARDLSARTLTEHLAPAVEQVMAGVVAAEQLLPDDLSAETLLRAPDETRQAWFTLADLAARYDAIRAAAAALRRVDEQPQYDTTGRFAELHNANEVTAGMNIQAGGPRPWPTETPGRLLWYVRHGGRVWLPTVEQMDARYFEVYRAEIERVGANRHALAAHRAAFG